LDQIKIDFNDTVLKKQLWHSKVALLLSSASDTGLKKAKSYS
jgi:hypothetical protein